MKKQWGSAILILMIAIGPAAAQSNAAIDTLIDKKEAACGETYLLALASAGLVKPEATVPEAMSYLEANKFGVTREPEAPVTLGDLCYVLMRAHQVPGGVMYAVSPGPRYATREFEYLGWVRRAPVPSRRVSGEEVLQIIGQVLEWKAPTAGEGAVQ